MLANRFIPEKNVHSGRMHTRNGTPAEMALMRELGQGLGRTGLLARQVNLGGGLGLQGMPTLVVSWPIWRGFTSHPNSSGQILPSHEQCVFHPGVGSVLWMRYMGRDRQISGLHGREWRWTYHACKAAGSTADLVRCKTGDSGKGVDRGRGLRQPYQCLGRTKDLRTIKREECTHNFGCV